jgi:hypothetical protein
MYEDLNERYEFKWEVKKSLKAYLEDTKDARSKLKAEAQDWNTAAKRVDDMYAAAWNYQVAESKYTAATEAKPASIELQDPKGVSNKWRAAAQADEDLGKDIVSDI